MHMDFLLQGDIAGCIKWRSIELLLFQHSFLLWLWFMQWLWLWFMLLQWWLWLVVVFYDFRIQVEKNDFSQKEQEILSYTFTSPLLLQGGNRRTYLQQRRGAAVREVDYFHRQLSSSSVRHSAFFSMIWLPFCIPEIYDVKISLPIHRKP